MAFTSAVLILFSLFVSFSANPFDSNPGQWWSIEMDISVQGEYQKSRDQKLVSGSYRFKLFYQAAMERDNGDYILYQGESRVNTFAWEEVADGQIWNLGKRLKPWIKLNYLIRKNRGIHADFETYLTHNYFDGVGKTIKVILPSSAENESIRPDSTYNNHITKGSNRISIPENLIYEKKESGKVFAWEWEKGKPGKKQRHSVVLTLKITRKQSK